MTQDSNRSAQVPWGERPATPPPPAPWLGLLTVPSLLAHVVVMLFATSVLTVINLLAGPRVWWSLAILVVWLAVVIIHGIGVGSRSLLFEEEERVAAPPRPRVEPIGPAIPGWLTLPRRGAEAGPPIPESWELKEDPAGPSWPEPGAARAQPAVVAPRGDEKVPWRAATDIAWLRRPKPAADKAEPPSGKEASS